MAIMDGCESVNKVPLIEERKCPNCGELVEVYTRKGRICEEVKCDCGYVFEIQPEPEIKPREVDTAE